MSALDGIVQRLRLAGFVARISPWEPDCITGGTREVRTTEGVVLTEDVFSLMRVETGWVLRTTMLGAGERDTPFVSAGEALAGVLAVLRAKVDRSR